MRQMMKIGVLMPAAVLLVSGCATKDWVREQFTKSPMPSSISAS